MATKPPRKIGFAKAPSYFEHQENKHIPDIKRYDIVEWTDESLPKLVEVAETRNQRMVQRVRRKLEKLYKDKS
jgi:hypothetical protein